MLHSEKQRNEKSMQTLHIFNPEHDIALAYNDELFTPPHAGRAMRADLSFLPVFWSEDGDVIVVDDVDQALEKIRHFKRKLPQVTFITVNKLPSLAGRDIDIDVWGWDSSIRHTLLRKGLKNKKLPTDEALRWLREISHRQWGAEILSCVRQDTELTIGEAELVTTIEAINNKLAQGGAWVLKAPWSCSGRGVRYVEKELSQQIRSWMAKIIHQQGGIMMEPKYNKVKDFGMEFYSDGKGNITYKGLSLFQTANGAYAGNLLATEDDKIEILQQYLSIERLGEITEKLIKCFSTRLRNIYKGPLGVDMMIVASAGNRQPCLLHPCVEVNLRRTMGHVALSLAPTPFDPQQLMRITYDGHYHLKISNIQTNNSIDK